MFGLPNPMAARWGPVPSLLEKSVTLCFGFASIAALVPRLEYMPLELSVVLEADLKLQLPLSILERTQRVPQSFCRCFLLLSKSIWPIEEPDVNWKQAAW